MIFNFSHKKSTKAEAAQETTTAPAAQPTTEATQAGYHQPRFTPGRINYLAPQEVFVFGSNLQGMHGAGAARTAVDKFGAIWGQGVGMQGQCYAIPTMHGGVEVIKPYVDEFFSFAEQNPDKVFLVTRIGCGIAGFTDEEMAQLFARGLEMSNVVLPRSFCKCLGAVED